MKIFGNNPIADSRITKFNYIMLLGVFGTGKTLVACSYLYPGEKCPDGRLAKYALISFDGGGASVEKRIITQQNPNGIIYNIPCNYDIRIGSKEWLALPMMQRTNPKEELEELVACFKNNRIGNIDLSDVKVVIFDGIHKLSQMLDDQYDHDFGLVDKVDITGNVMRKFGNVGKYQKMFFENKLRFLNKYVVMTLGYTLDEDENTERSFYMPNLVGGVRNSIGHAPDAVFYLNRNTSALSKDRKTIFEMIIHGNAKFNTKFRIDPPELALKVPPILQDEIGVHTNNKLYLLRHLQLFGEWRPDITWDKLTKDQQELINSDPALYSNSDTVTKPVGATNTQPEPAKKSFVKPAELANHAIGIRNFQKKQEVIKELDDANAQHEKKYLEGETDDPFLTQDKVEEIVNRNIEKEDENAKN